MRDKSFYVTFAPNVNTVKWTIQDSSTSVNSYGQDNANSRRLSFLWDSTKQQYFFSSTIFGNTSAFLESFYYQASPPFDPTTTATAQTPTHFIVRDPFSLVQKVLVPITVADYQQAISIVNDTTGNYVGGTVIVAFLYTTDSITYTTLFGVPVDVSNGTYIATTNT